MASLLIFSRLSEELASDRGEPTSPQDRKIHFLVVYAVSRHEPYSILKVTQDTTANEVCYFKSEKISAILDCFWYFFVLMNSLWFLLRCLSYIFILTFHDLLKIRFKKKSFSMRNVAFELATNQIFQSI